jgi:hypothetical protein
VPYLPLIAAPTSRLYAIAQDVEFSIAQSTTKCVQPDPLNVIGAKMVAVGRQSAGFRFMLGIVSLGDADRSSINLASLQTYNGGSRTAQFTNAEGRSFVAPDTAGLRAAAKLLTPDAKTGVWNLPYRSIATTAADASAYPGAMMIYTAIPTTGVPKADAHHYSQFLTYVAGPGQRSGAQPGELAPGYLPITSANDLGVQQAYILRAARAVAAQKGYLPSLTKADPVPPSTSPSTVPTGSNGGTGPTGTGQDTGGSTPISTPSGSTGKPSTKPSPKPSSSPTKLGPTEHAGKTMPLNSGFGGVVLPLLLLVALLASAGVALTRLLGRGARVS